MTKFTNPYADSPNLVRLQTYIDKTDHQFIKSIHPDKGTLEITVNTLWSRFCDALRKHKINQLANNQDYERFVNEFTIEVPNGFSVSGGTARRSPRKTR